MAPTVILLVDGEPDLVVTHARLLRRHGLGVMSPTGAGVRAGGDSVTHGQPALVITELRLSDGDGLDVIPPRCGRAV